MYGLLSGAVLQLVGSVVGAAWFGWWLDQKWRFTPVLTVVGALLGAVVGFWNLWQILRWKERLDEQDPD